MKFRLAATMLIAATVVARAEERNLDSEIKRCASYDDRGDRLACFDFVSGRKEPEVTAKPDDGRRQIGSWNTSEEPSKMDGSVSLYASVQASAARKGKASGAVVAALVIRCVEGKTSSFITFGDEKVAYKTATVQYRIGDGKPKEDTWFSSEDGSAYGLFSTKNNLQFVNSLAGNKTFYLRGSTDIYGSSEATFDISGVDDVIDSVRKRCKW